MLLPVIDTLDLYLLNINWILLLFKFLIGGTCPLINQAAFLNILIANIN